MRYSFHRTQLLPAALVLLAVLQFVVTSPLLLAKNIPRSPESREAAGLVQPEPLEVTPRSLQKRKCTENGQKSKKGNPKFTCDDDPIARDEIRDRAKPQSNVATLFYVNLNQGQGLKQGKAYLKDKNIAFVSYDTLVDNLWSKAVAQNFQQSPDDAVKANVDRYQKCQSQVLAEKASGDVYVFTKSDEEPSSGSTWIGWELPMLQRNPNVQTIYRVDPRCGKDKNGKDIDTTPQKIWSKGDTVNTPDPKCTDGTDPAY